MSKFTKGQKIVFYDAGCRFVGYITSPVDSDGCLTAKAEGNEFELHVKQCRKIKPRVKTGRRFRGAWKRMFVNDSSSAQQMAFVPNEPFIEVKNLEGHDDELIQIRSNA